MNRTLNQLINQLHLDPKKEAAVRKIVENAGGINDSTPVVTEVSGNELLPINVNGENKAVTAAALVKGAKEVYFLDINNYKTSEDYNNLKAAVESNKIIIVDIEGVSFIAIVMLSPNQILLSLHVAVIFDKHNLQINTFFLLNLNQMVHLLLIIYL